MQCACAVLYCHLWPVRLHIFPQYLIKGTIFGKKKLLTIIISSFSPQLLSDTFPILRRTERNVIINTQRFSCKVSRTLVRFWRNLYFLDTLSKNTQIPNLKKICLVGAEMFHADGQTDTEKPIAVFRNFANAPKSIKYGPRFKWTRTNYNWSLWN
jgi:hypothetical protein